MNLKEGFLVFIIMVSSARIQAETAIRTPLSDTQNFLNWISKNPEHRSAAEIFLNRDLSNAKVSDLHQIVDPFINATLDSNELVNRLKTYRSQNVLSKNTRNYLFDFYGKYITMCKSKTCSEWFRSEISRLGQLSDKEKDLSTVLQDTEIVIVDGEELRWTEQRELPLPKESHFWAIYSSSKRPFYFWGTKNELSRKYILESTDLVKPTTHSQICTDLNFEIQSLELGPEPLIYVSNECVHDQRMSELKSKPKYQSWIWAGVGIVAVGVLANSLKDYQIEFDTALRW